MRTPDTRGRDIAVQCTNYIEIETTATLATENGAFQETLPVTLRAEHALAASAVVVLHPGEMNGDFDLREEGPFQLAPLDERQPDQVERGQTRLDLSLFPERATATMTSYYGLISEDGDVSSMSGTEVTFGRSLGKGACYEEDFTPLLEDGEAISHLSALFAETPRLALDFDKGAEDTELLAQFETSNFCLSTWSANTLFFSLDLVLTRSGDESAFATWPLHGYAVYSKSGELERLALDMQGPAGPVETIEESVGTWGDFGVDFNEANHADFAIFLRYESNAWEGDLTIQALHLSDESECGPKLDPHGDLYAGTCPLISDAIVAEASIKQIE